ncbi:MAG: DinB family protein [Candidatus Thorarchaeota archaeon]
MLIEHNNTCREPLLDSLRQLENDDFTQNLGSSSIRDILVHLMNSEIYWISLLNNLESVPLNPDEFADVETIARTWKKIERETREFVSEQTDISLQHVKTMRWGDSTVSFTIGKALVHMATHEVHHRGFIIGILRQMGHEPPNVNMI